MNIEMLFARSMPEPNTGCWIWLGAVQSMGYGCMSVNRKSRLAHRLSFECVNGAIPDGISVCHRCDTPICINPDHLFVGSHKENMIDMVAKGRWSGPDVKGEKHPRSRLTAQDIGAIRNDARSAREIAAQYGIARTYVYDIKNRKFWSHIP